MKQMTLVVSNLINELKRVRSDLYQTEFTFHNYILFNEDGEKFKKYLEKVANERKKENDKNRTRDSLSNNR